MRDHAPRSSVFSRLRIAVALLALLLATALPAQADVTDPAISVTAGNGRTVTIAWSQLEGKLDADSVAYRQGQATPRGIFLQTALAEAGLPEETYSAVTASDGTQLDKLDFVRDAVIVFRDEAGTLQLLRTSGGAIAGMEALVPAAPDGTLALRVTQDPQLISSLPQVPSGGSLSFHATIPALLDPKTVTYEWDFNDGGSTLRTKAPTATRTFTATNRQNRTFNVSVTLYVNGRRYDDMLPLFAPQVEVIADDRYAGDVPDKRSARSAGRDRTGVSDGERRRTTSTPPPPTGGDVPAADTPDTGTAAPTTAPPAGTPVTPAATPTPTPAPSPTPTPTPTPRRTAEPPRRAAPRRPEQPAGETVDGYLLAAADVPLPLTDGADLKARSAQQIEPQQESTPLELPTPVWVGIGLLALVMLGWGLESRTTLPYFRP